MTEKQRQYMKARQRVEETLVNPALALLNATGDLVAEYRNEAAKTESLHTTIQVLRNMNEDGQFGARIALEQIWKFLGVQNQTAAMDALRELRELAHS